MSVEAANAGADWASRWHRLRYTPLRDVFRGRVSGRLDIEPVIAAAELPDPVAKLVRLTVRRTRLWRLEKVEVARELAAHFQDGLEAGATADELVKSFGDPRQAGRLIRRAKVRNRPAAWKATRFVTRALLAFFALLFVLWLGLTVRLHVGEVRLSRNYLAELNAPMLATPEQDRAWPLYRQGYLATSKFPKYKQLGPSDENWPTLAAFAEENAEALELYRQAARKPHLGVIHGTRNDDELAYRHEARPPETESKPAPPIEENPPFISVLLNHLSSLREASALLVLDAHVAAQAGDAARVGEDVEAILQIVEHVSETPVLISDLVAFAVLVRDTDLVGMLLRDHPELFSDRQLVALSHRLAAVRGGGALRVRLSAERWTFEDLVQRLYTDDGHGNGHLTADAPRILASLYGGSPPDSSVGLLSGSSGLIAAPGFSAVVVDRREMLRKHDELMMAAETEAVMPLWERGESAADHEIDRMNRSTVERARYLPVAILMPCLSRASEIAELATQRRDATLTALACELYRRHNGDWPVSLAELTPRYLPAVPVDRFDGQPLRYRLVDGAPLIYSIGMDGDDDGGRLPHDDKPERANKGARNWHPPRQIAAMKAANSPELADGDWILWPPVD